VNPRRMQLVRTITLRGYFSFDALSPNGSRMYLIQYTHGDSQDLTHYIVRGYDLRTNRLLRGRIADRSEHEEAMAGSPVTRTTSADGRWVYTLYQKPSGEQVIHALATGGSGASRSGRSRARGAVRSAPRARRTARFRASQPDRGKPSRSASARPARRVVPSPERRSQVAARGREGERSPRASLARAAGSCRRL